MFQCLNPGTVVNSDGTQCVCDTGFTLNGDTCESICPPGEVYNDQN